MAASQGWRKSDWWWWWSCSYNASSTWTPKTPDQICAPCLFSRQCLTIWIVEIAAASKWAEQAKRPAQMAGCPDLKEKWSLPLANGLRRVVPTLPTGKSQEHRGTQVEIHTPKNSFILLIKHQFMAESAWKSRFASSAIGCDLWSWPFPLKWHLHRTNGKTHVSVFPSRIGPPWPLSKRLLAVHQCVPILNWYLLSGPLWLNGLPTVLWIQNKKVEQYA